MPEDTTVHLPDGTNLQGFLEGEPRVGTVVFAHGSGSGRHSPRNRHVAEVLQGSGIQTLLLDLLTMEEERQDLVTREHRFDIGLLSERVVGAVDWLPDMVRVGLFGASTGAAAALRAAADRPDRVAAVVSRGGRPDLADDALPRVEAPTLLIVGERDLTVLDLNRLARAQMRAETELETVPGATHLFEEPGTLDVVADLAADWFVRHLGRGGRGDE
jgi:pimeloyl-ACP methyl ester carboxylesterase